MDANAIRIKSAASDGRTAARTLFDTKNLIQGTAEYRFFPPQATGKSTRDNYRSNPFATKSPARLYGIGVEINLPVIATAANINPQKVIAALADAIVEVRVLNDTQTLFTAPLSQFVKLGAGVTATGAGNDLAILVQNGGIVELPQPYDIGIQETVDVILRLHDASTLPTEAHWAAAGLTPLHAKAKLQVVDMAVFAEQQAAAQAGR